MFQKKSALILWYGARTADSRIGARKTMIVTLARKLGSPDDSAVMTGFASGRKGTCLTFPLSRALLRRAAPNSSHPVARPCGLWSIPPVSAVPLPIQMYAPGFCSRKNAKSSAPMLGNSSRRTLISPTIEAAAAAAASVSAGAFKVGGYRRSYRSSTSAP